MSRELKAGLFIGFFLMLGWLAFCQPVGAAPLWKGPFRATCEWKDGDTGTCTFLQPCPFCLAAPRLAEIRFFGIDAGEIHKCRPGTSAEAARRQNCAPCKFEYDKGIEALNWLRDNVGNRTVTISNVTVDKYSLRYVGAVALDGKALGPEMVRLELAALYGADKDFKPLTGKNRLTKSKAWCGK